MLMAGVGVTSRCHRCKVPCFEVLSFEQTSAESALRVFLAHRPHVGHVPDRPITWVCNARLAEGLWVVCACFCILHNYSRRCLLCTKRLNRPPLPQKVLKSRHLKQFLAGVGVAKLCTQIFRATIHWKYPEIQQYSPATLSKERFTARIHKLLSDHETEMSTELNPHSFLLVQ